VVPLLLRHADPRPAQHPGRGLAAAALVTWRAVHLDQSAAVPALLAFTALGVALSAIDLDVRRLPDVLVLAAYPLLAGLLAVPPNSGPTGGLSAGPYSGRGFCSAASWPP
jgi:prepilin signal peptidase PulO-like enzyme (type II secretory pathway)